MLVKSLIDNSEWIWVKIPNTGLVFYEQVLSYGMQDEVGNISYPENLQFYNKQVPGFTVVRHPTTRFASSLKQTISKYVRASKPVPSVFNSISSICDFFYSKFDSNGILKPEFNYDTVYDGQRILALHLIVRTQTQMAYHRDMIFFKYEALSEFNTWITNTLGHSTNDIYVTDEITLPSPYASIDFNSSEFDALARYMFTEDYKNFKY